MTTSDYVEIAVIRRNDICAHVTRRISNLGAKQYSYRFQRVFSSGGDEKYSHWMNPRHLPDVNALTADIAEVIEKDRATTK